MNGHSFGGAQYLSKGFQLIKQPGIKRFVFVPLLINFIFLAIATFYAFDLINDWYTSLPVWLESHLNSEHWYVRWPTEALNWLISTLDWLLWPLIVLSVFIVVFFMFSFFANWIAAPFNGLLSEAVEKHLDSENFDDVVFNWSVFIKDIPRLIGREWKKFKYYIPRVIVCLILLFTPISPFVPIIWFMFNSWMAAIQYIDYPADNHRLSFQYTLNNMQQSRSGPFGFGVMVMLFTMVPVVNILIMPIAVAGGTNLWFDHYKKQEE